MRYHLKEKLKLIFGNSGTYRRNVVIMSSSAFINVGTAIILFPIITRLFSKEDFGGFALYMAVVGLISLAGTALYPTGLVIPKFKREFLALLKLSFYLTLLTSVISLVLIILFDEIISKIFKLNHLGGLIYFIPLGVFLTSLHLIFTNWNIRKKHFVKNATSLVISGFSAKLLNIAYAIGLYPSTFGLIICQLISIIITIMSLGAFKMLREIKQLRLIKINQVIWVAKKFYKYPKHLLPANIINKYTSDLPIYMLTGYFSPGLTGAFFLANSILTIPLNVIGNSIASVFLQKANELYLVNPESMAMFAYRTYKNMLYIGALAFGFIFGFGEILFSYVFGKEWIIAGKIAEILSIYYIFKLISGPLAKVYRVVGKEEYSLQVSIYLALFRVLGVVVGVLSGDPIMLIVYFTIGNLAGYFINTIMIFKAINLPVFRPICETLIIILITYLVFYGLNLNIE